MAVSDKQDDKVGKEPFKKSRCPTLIYVGPGKIRVRENHPVRLSINTAMEVDNTSKPTADWQSWGIKEFRSCTSEALASCRSEVPIKVGCYEPKAILILKKID